MIDNTSVSLYRLHEEDLTKLWFLQDETSNLLLFACVENNNFCDIKSKSLIFKILIDNVELDMSEFCVAPQGQVVK